MKLFVIVRADLKPGQQAVQAAHAFREFVATHQELENVWYRNSNTLAMLAVPSETALELLLRKAADRGIRWAVFREPDLSDSLTAIVLEPCKEATRLCRDLPLALNS